MSEHTARSLQLAKQELAQRLGPEWKAAEHFQSMYDVVVVHRIIGRDTIAMEVVNLGETKPSWTAVLCSLSGFHLGKNVCLAYVDSKASPEEALEALCKQVMPALQVAVEILKPYEKKE